MIRYRIAPMAGLALLLAAGCIEAPQDETPETEVALRASTTELQRDVRSSLDQLGAQMERLDQRYSSATDDMAAMWVDTRSEIREYREELETDLANLEGATVEGAETLKREMAENIEQLTERLERAELEAVEDNQEFLSASQDRMVRLEEDLEILRAEAASLSGEARDDASGALEGLRDRASELGSDLDELAHATEDEISSQRGDIAQAFGALTASVRRELFEMRQALR